MYLESSQMTTLLGKNLYLFVNDINNIQETAENLYFFFLFTRACSRFLVGGLGLAKPS